MPKVILPFALLLGQLPYGSGIVRLKPLPTTTKIHVEHWVWDSPKAPNVQTQCPYMTRLAAKRVRQMFATYHLLRDMEEHESYLWYGCSAIGTIKVDGKTFHFTVRPLNLLTTDWPDGEWKPLGGKHSDGQSDN